MTDSPDQRNLIPTDFGGPQDDLPDFGDAAPEPEARDSNAMDAVFEVPVSVQAVLGGAKLAIGELLRMKSGTVIELDRRVGEAVDLYVNGRLIARGELVLMEGVLGVTLTELVKEEE